MSDEASKDFEQRTALANIEQRHWQHEDGQWQGTTQELAAADAADYKRLSDRDKGMAASFLGARLENSPEYREAFSQEAGQASVAELLDREWAHEAQIADKEDRKPAFDEVALAGVVERHEAFANGQWQGSEQELAQADAEALEHMDADTRQQAMAAMASSLDSEAAVREDVKQAYLPRNEASDRFILSNIENRHVDFDEQRSSMQEMGAEDGRDYRELTEEGRGRAVEFMGHHLLNSPEYRAAFVQEAGEDAARQVEDRERAEVALSLEKERAEGSFDLQGLANIEQRHLDMADGAWEGTAQELAEADAEDYRHLSDEARQRLPSEVFDSLRHSPEFRQAFTRELGADVVTQLEAAEREQRQAKQAQAERIAADTARVQSALHPARDARQQDAELGANDQDKEQNERQEENAVFDGRERHAESQPRPQQRESENRLVSDELFMATEQDHALRVPRDVDRLFLKVGEDKYHFKNAPDNLAFVDKGNKLTTPSNSHMVAETLVRIAEQRGWDEIRVTGSETFRREAWFEAAQRGIQVRGYTPTEVDQAKLAELMKGRSASALENPQVDRSRLTEPPAKASEAGDKALSKGESLAKSYLTEPAAKALAKAPELAGAFAAREAARQYLAKLNLNEQEKATVMERIDVRMGEALREGRIPKVNKEERAQGVTGLVVDHGKAPYKFDQREKESYFVKVETDKGTRVIWGKDLERVAQENGIRNGDRYTFQIAAQRDVPVRANVIDKQTGAVVDTRETTARRNEWKATKEANARMVDDPRKQMETHRENQRVSEKEQER